MADKLKRLEWIGSSYEDLNAFPREIRRAMGYAIHLAQIGEVHPHAKVFKGTGSAKVLEIRESDRAGTYRTVYTLEMKNFIFVIHAFQKKSKSGIATPKKELELIESRLKEAKAFYEEFMREKK